MRLLTLPFFCLLLLLSSACGDDEAMEPMPPEDNTQVPVTTVKFILSGGTQGSTTYTYFEPPSPEPGVELPPEVDDIVLDANTTYTYRTIVENTSGTGGTQTQTEKIEDDGEDYLFVFDVLAASLSVIPNDMDINGDPIGLQGTFETGPASSGVLMFKILFETNKSAPGANGDRVIGGSFNVEIQ